MYKSFPFSRHDARLIRQRQLTVFGLVAVLVMLVTGSSAKASVIQSDMCDQAAVVASGAFGVPLPVMRAITRTETGRTKGGKLRPWPWTVNMEGKGAWFENEEAAMSYVSRHFDRGARSFDVGCFQINYKWHGQAFSSISEMFDPIQNANYAAQFLRKLHSEFGSWDLAAGAFHSRTPKFANRYIARFQTIKATLDDAPTVPTQPRQKETQVARNTYPLLRAPKTPSRMGSLVPLGRGKAAFLPRIGG